MLYQFEKSGIVAFLILTFLEASPLICGIHFLKGFVMTLVSRKWDTYCK